MKIVKKVLKNGLTVIIIPMKHFNSTITSVFIKSGSRDEFLEEHGIAHFLEHMVFKGTKKRNTPEKVSSSFGKLGCSYNASTSLEFTSYYAVGYYKEVNKMLDIIIDLYKNPIFKKAEIEKEKRVIYEEMSLYEDNEYELLSILIYKVLFGEHPIGRKILGTRESIKKLKVDNLIEFRDRNYVPNNTIVLVCGNVKPKSIMSVITQKMGSLKRKDIIKRRPTCDFQNGMKVITLNMPIKQVYIAIVFKTFPIGDDRNIATLLLSEILAAGDTNSRLFKELRQKRGLAYNITSYNSVYEDTGFLTIETSVASEGVDKSLDIIIKTITDIIKRGIGVNEYNLAKKKIITHLSFALETPSDYVSYYAERELYGIKDTIEDKINKIKGLNVKDIHDLAKLILCKQNTNVICMGAIKSKEKSIINILKRMPSK